MKVKKMEKNSGIRQTEPAIYVCAKGIRLNAESRDFLAVPEFISVEFENNKIVLSGGTKEDYKVSYTKNGVQGISGSMFQSGTFAKIPNRTKIFGVRKNKKLEFEIPKKYITDECDSE